MSNPEWQNQKVCTDIGEYELIVERQKSHTDCEQNVESWKWNVIYHGAIVASGTVNDFEEAKQKAEANVPDSAGN